MHLQHTSRFARSKAAAFRSARRAPSGQVAAQVMQQSIASVSSSSQITEKLERLNKHKLEWRDLDLKEKIKLLQEVKGRLLHNTYSWGKAAAAAKGLADSQEQVCSELLNCVFTSSAYISKVVEVMQALDQQGACPRPPVRELPGGQLAVKVWPTSPSEKSYAPLPDAEMEIYLEPGQPASQGAKYLGAAGRQGGKLYAMLGAGNHGFLGLKDVLCCLVEENSVCAFKPHPTQVEWHSFADYVLAPLASRGFYANVGSLDLEETREFLYHPLVEAVHMTGGAATYDAIVWGSSPEEQARRKAARDPLLKVPMTAELGCVTPWIVTPGPWTEEQLVAQARNVAIGLSYNNSCNCNSPKVLLLPQCWDQADDFMSKVEAELKLCKLLPAHYPGIKERYAAWRSQYPYAREVSAPVIPSSRPDFDAHLPFLIAELPGVPQQPEKEYAFQVEAFAPVLAVVRLPGSTAQEFLEGAVELCNRGIRGTLSCSLLLHPSVEEEQPEVVNKALADLKYGTIAVNSWSGMAYCLPSTWGAHPGHTPEDIGSGVGHVGNSYLLDHAQKTIYRVPIVGEAVPKPLHYRAIPTAVVKALAGYLVGGWAGIGKALLWMK